MKYKECKYCKKNKYKKMCKQCNDAFMFEFDKDKIAKEELRKEKYKLRRMKNGQKS